MMYLLEYYCQRLYDMSASRTIYNILYPCLCLSVLSVVVFFAIIIRTNYTYLIVIIVVVLIVDFFIDR